MKIKVYFIRRYVSVIAMFFMMSLNAQDAKFTVVLDAGHGGHDPGAMGAISKEKDINLSVTLDLGALIEQRYKDVKVVYTRKTDKYLTLQERADVVNDNHADLFICIHTNSSPSPAAYGAESFTLGLAKTKGNLDVAMRENSVITLEDNYKTKYQGFDPRSVDSYIMFEFMQDKYLDRSVNFASIIQKQFRNYCKRLDRGVRQAGFWVLYRSACPSVLVELGFISNPLEEHYLASDAGQREMASGIFNAFVDYKREYDRKSGRQSVAVDKIEQPVVKDKLTQISDSLKNKKMEASSKLNTKEMLAQEDVVTKGLKKSLEKRTDTLVVHKTSTDSVKSSALSTIPVFKVQLMASVKKLSVHASDFKGLKGVEFFVENGVNKYTVGNETNYSKIEKIRSEVSSKFPQAFIIAFLGDKKISAKEALKALKDKK